MATQSIQLNPIFPAGFQVKVREDVPKFTIWVGDPQPVEVVDGFIFADYGQVDDNGNIVQLASEYVENDYTGSTEEIVEMETRSDLQSEYISDAPSKTEDLSIDFNDPKFVGGAWKNYNIDNLISEISKTSHSPNSKFKESLRKILLWIKKDKDITDVREASYLLGTAYAEAGYSLQRWESDYLGKGIGIPYGPNNPIPQSALNYYRSTKNGKKNYYTDLGGLDSKGLPYFGRGLIQLTGKANYEKYGNKIGVNLVNNADLALKEENSYKIAVIFLSSRTFKHVKNNNLTQARKSVNGGTKGINEVNGAYNDWLKIFNKS